MLHANIVTPETRHLVSTIEDASTTTAQAEENMARLVEHLAERCETPSVRARYEDYALAEGTMEPYPLETDGFATAFDPLEEESDIFETWLKYGVVIARNVVPDELCAAAIKKMHHTTQALSSGECDLVRPETFDKLPVDPQGVPLLSRGFFEVYHDDTLAQLRQSLRLYLHHVILWGRADLWTTFDRLGVKLPGHAESAALPLHVDQNPNVHPHFKTTQGVLALEDCSPERGTLVAAPGSKQLFSAYGKMALNKGEYVQLETDSPAGETLSRLARPLPIRKGSIATWDSRTTHANTANVSAQTRYIALISAGPARQDSPGLVAVRDEAFASGLGSNVREALMHASMKPRYTDEAALADVRTPEQLSLLGTLLYGQAKYA